MQDAHATPPDVVLGLRLSTRRFPINSSACTPDGLQLGLRIVLQRLRSVPKRTSVDFHSLQNDLGIALQRLSRMP